MKPDELLKVLQIAGKLKETTRHCEILPNRLESVADHSYRMALMGMLLEKEFPNTDMCKVIKMCLIHDLGEAFTGDIPTFLKTEKQKNDENDKLSEWLMSFPRDERLEWQELYEEMSALETEEAKIFKAIDKLEAVISHNESDISSWLPLEYDLQFEYGKENVQFSSYFTELKELIDSVTREKIENKNIK